MADQQQRYIVSKFPVQWPTGFGDATVRVDTSTGKTWVLVGSMGAGSTAHTLKWQIVDDPDLQKQAPALPPLREVDVSGR